jgi:hypothetical protein
VEALRNKDWGGREKRKKKMKGVLSNSLSLSAPRLSFSLFFSFSPSSLY